LNYLLPMATRRKTQKSKNKKKAVKKTSKKKTGKKKAVKKAGKKKAVFAREIGVGYQTFINWLRG